MNKIANYFKGTKEELSKIVWPSKEVTINNTIIVIAVSIGVALFLGVVDLGLSELVGSLIK